MLGLISGFCSVNLLVESFFSDLLETGWYNLVLCGVLADDKAIVVGFCSVGSWCFLDNECRIQEHLHSFRKMKYPKVVPRLFRWIYKTIRSEFSIQVFIVDSQPGKLRSNPRRKQFLSLFLWSLCSNPMEDKVVFV